MVGLTFAIKPKFGRSRETGELKARPVYKVSRCLEEPWVGEGQANLVHILLNKPLSGNEALQMCTTNVSVP